MFHKITNIYVSPGGFDFDVTSNDPDFETDTKLDSYNAPQEAQNLDGFLENLGNVYLTDHLFVLWGMDF